MLGQCKGSGTCGVPWGLGLTVGVLCGVQIFGMKSPILLGLGTVWGKKVGWVLVGFSPNGVRKPGVDLGVTSTFFLGLAVTLSKGVLSGGILEKVDLCKGGGVLILNELSMYCQL